MAKLKVNGKNYEVAVPESTPLLWVIREEIGLTGTKFGCGKGLCGSCTVQLGTQSIRSCITPLAAAAEQEITTIEGEGTPAQPSIVQKAWQAENVPQCGYCQSGQIMSASSLLKQNPKPSEEDIKTFMSGNICRCGTYPRINKAIKRASKELANG